MTTPGHIGQYRILRKIGAGGMGMVFAGEHLLLQRRAAIKTLQPALSKQPELVDRFFNEARATSAIEDPGIVQVFDFGYHVDGTAYIVMELLEGEGLADRLDRLGTLPIQSALRIARQVASSLAAAHAKGIVHRDLKPDNVFLIRDREAQGGERTKLLDFGICAVAEAPETDAPPGTMIGTPVYMSPEQCRGLEHGDPRCDIYSLGCVLFQMLTGRAPFERATVSAVIRAHLTEPPPPPSVFREDVPPQVDELVLRCLEKVPEERFASMAELGAALELALARLWAPEPLLGDVTPAVPLATGFRSAFDANAATYAFEPAEPTEPAEPASGLLTLTPEGRGGALRRAALGLALLAGALLASFATRFTDGDDALARATRSPAAGALVAPAAAAELARPMPAPAAAPRAAASAAQPAASPARPRLSAEARAAAEGKPATASRPTGRAPAIQRSIPASPASIPASIPTAAARPRPAPPSPVPAAPARAQAQTQAASSEDLYDMR